MRRHLVVYAIFLILTSCTWASEPGFVIHVSVDGLRGDLLATLLQQDSTGALPSFRRFVTHGTSTFNARTDVTHTNTLPNHTTMLTGRPVSQPPGQPNTVHHGWTSNNEPAAGVTLHNGGNPNLTYIAGVFDVVHDAGLSTALYTNKTKFVLFDRSWNETYGALDLVPPDHGRDKVDRYLCIGTSGSPPGSQVLHDSLMADLVAVPRNYVFVHYAELDVIGHSSGWGGTLWRQALQALDAQIGELQDLVDTDPHYAGRAVLMLTADHGGSGLDHSNASLAADFTIPFLVYGAGVKAGIDLYALNIGTRADPGTVNPPYATAPPPIRNGDAANLALTLLRLAPIPGSTLNARQDLHVYDWVPVARRSWTSLKGSFR
jgi:hypothetical protein